MRLATDHLGDYDIAMPIHPRKPKVKTRIRWSSIGAPLLLGLAAWSCQVVGPRSELSARPPFR